MSQEGDNGLAEGLHQAVLQAGVRVEAANPAQGDKGQDETLAVDPGLKALPAFARSELLRRVLESARLCSPA
jgi:hypothetical protein